MEMEMLKEDQLERWDGWGSTKLCYPGPSQGKNVIENGGGRAGGA